MLKFTPLTHGLLGVLHDILVRGKGKWVGFPSIAENFPVEISDDYVRTSLDELQRRQWADYNSDKDAISISIRGINYVEKQLDKEGSLLAEFSELRYDFFEKHGGIPRNKHEDSTFVSEGVSNSSSAVENNIPAADREVSKKDNIEAWDDSAKALNNAIEGIEGEKSLDNELGPEKQALLAALKASRELFEDTKIKVDIAIAMTLEPLKVAADRYKDVAIGGLIVKAIDVITDFLGKAL